MKDEEEEGVVLSEVLQWGGGHSRCTVVTWEIGVENREDCRRQMDGYVWTKQTAGIREGEVIAVCRVGASLNAKSLLAMVSLEYVRKKTISPHGSQGPFRTDLKPAFILSSKLSQEVNQKRGWRREGKGKGEKKENCLGRALRPMVREVPKNRLQSRSPRLPQQRAWNGGG